MISAIYQVLKRGNSKRVGCKEDEAQSIGKFQ
jgi:hypothetical protein